MKLKPEDYRPLHELLQSAIDPDELADILDDIAVNYARLSLKEGIDNTVSSDTPEQVFLLFELRNVFQEVSDLSKNV